VDPREAILNELLENINIKIDVDPRLELISSTIPKQLKVINPSKKSVLVYCFDCDLE
jgi:hypothetical protein